MTSERLPQVGEIEIECGVPIPGPILPQDQWARTAIKRMPDPATVDWDEIFGRPALLSVDLGCGNGRFTVSHALRHPEWNHLGVDILPMVIRYATRRGNQRGLHHTRFAVCGGLELLSDFIPDGKIAELHIYHPQPYRESGEAHRRVLTPEFFCVAHRRIAAGGSFYFQTDNPAYWRYFEQVASHFFALTVQDGPWPEDPQGRTRREIVARSQGLPIFRAVGRRRDELTEADYERLGQELPQPEFDGLDDHPQQNRPPRRHRPRRRRK